MKDTRNWQISINNPGVIVEGVEDIAQCVYTILTTIKGSDPLRPDFGSNVMKYIDRPVNEVQSLLAYEVIYALEIWESRINVRKCRYTSDETGKSNIYIEAEVIASAAQVTITINV
ncbi:MAG: GPW/gp25 family protein [Prevotellaceae bacterium]|jgi:phage baseplate assembly protein W|nr:GPW/gp25 family protein [Prevotellaceae bacterium]